MNYFIKSEHQIRIGHAGTLAILCEGKESVSCGAWIPTEAYLEPHHLGFAQNIRFGRTPDNCAIVILFDYCTNGPIRNLPGLLKALQGDFGLAMRTAERDYVRDVGARDAAMSMTHDPSNTPPITDPILIRLIP